MKKIIATWPAEPKTNDASKIALVYAGVLIVMTVAQLFSFEKFIPLLDDFGVSGYVVATLLVVCGVLALPFLLRMKLSIGFRWVSMVAGWVVAAMWVFLTILVNVGDFVVPNVGLLGASITLLPGWWAVFVALALCVLAAWASWGLWPGSPSLEKRRKK